MENENDQEVEETTEEEVEETEEEKEGKKEKPEKPKLTLEQKRGILKRQLTRVEKELGIAPEEKPEKPKEPSEPDYASKINLLTLKSEGITHAEDQKLVLDEATRLKLPVEEIIAMEYIKSKLKTAKDQREASEGMPKGRGKGGGQTQNDVEYWVDKKNSDGSYKTPDDPDLAGKVIEARIKKEAKANKFSDELYTG